MNTPLFSIITINRNNAEGLQKTIDSVINQTYPNFEYIIIDGGSDDGSFEIIQNNQSELAYWISEPDKGIYHAMNKGIQQATGEYCLFLNSGDWLVEGILQTIQEYLKNTTALILYGNLYLAYSIKEFKTLCYPTSLDMRYFFKSTIGHQSTFIHRDLLLKIFH